jgi:starch synthase (maltosyl-transferring)
MEHNKPAEVEVPLTDAVGEAPSRGALPDHPRRVVIERVEPEIDGGRFPIKRCVGEQVQVSADIFADGQDLLAGVVRYRHCAAGQPPGTWHEVPLTNMGNDRWTASFTAAGPGTCEYTIEAWIDPFATWLKGLLTKASAGQDVTSELLEGAELVHRTASASNDSSGPTEADDRLRLLEFADTLRGTLLQPARVAAARDPELRALMESQCDRSAATTYDRILIATVDPERARFGAWYEMFPRSCTTDPSRSGTFRDAEERLPDLADMGFDVVYLPPIHPIGRTGRKGRNNTLAAQPADPGSPWAIGSAAGGHIAVDPDLGTLDDFHRFVGLANRLELDVALDIAFQTSPDHPWVHEHPEWFKRRPDGSIKYAENPPKKYQDIYPFDFDSVDWRSLWTALRDVFLFWASHGVRMFRVDNPHTKPFAFWEWVIAEVKRDYPDAIFLSEAFTRPKVMRHLAKAGFGQSYTYFTWRNTPQELREYLIELTRSELREYMRPNFFANTPDILHEYLQSGGRPAFEVRLILAATLSASYGIYSGFELCENVPLRPGSEEYVDSEKYQIKPRDWNAPGNIKELIARVNSIRRQHPALQHNTTLSFHETDNPAFLWFSKRDPVTSSRVFVVVNTDPHWMQHGWVQMPLWELGISSHADYVVEDLLDGAQYRWRGEWNYVRLDPALRVAHILVVRSEDLRSQDLRIGRSQNLKS